MEPDKKIDDDILFGPALIRAYELEKEKPGPPRIVIGSDVFEKADHHRGGSLWPEYLHRDDDGKFFIDYLFGAAVDGLFVIQNKPVNLINTLQAHKDAVERRIMSLTDEDEGVIEKHRWLLSNHNNTVQRLKKRYAREKDPYDIFGAEPFEVPDSLKIGSYEI